MNGKSWELLEGYQWSGLCNSYLEAVVMSLHLMLKCE